MSVLGQCDKCKSLLCVRHQRVECSRCGRPVPDHPLMKELAAARASPKPAPVLDMSIDHSHCDAVRLRRMEEAVATLGQRVTELEKAGAGRRTAAR